MARVYYLEQVKIYPYPNPALTQVLVGPRLEDCVADYTAQVAQVYAQRLQARPRKDKRRRGDSMLSSMSAEVLPNNGYKNDRWVGEVRVGTQYALADELGRKKYAQYDGSGDLRESLHSILPFRP